MTDTQVFIEGLILLVSSGVYKNGLAGTGAAIAIHAKARPGTYGVDLPAHTGKLLIEKDKILAVLPHGTTLPDDASGEFSVVALDGKRVQLGKFASNTCSTIDPRTKAGAKDTLKNTPDLTKIGLPSTRIRDDARPSSTGDYTKVDPAHVSGWLEMLDGTLVDDTPFGTKAEFRPPSKDTFEPARGAKWMVKAAAPCLVVTPFQMGSAIVVVFDSSEPTVEMKYKNLPVSAGSGHAHGRVGVSYDYELLYDIFEKQPTVPPLPHHF
jgi:hypothetical protein